MSTPLHFKLQYAIIFVEQGSVEMVSSTAWNGRSLVRFQLLLPVLCDSGGMADASGLEPDFRKGVRVQVLPIAPDLAVAHC